MKRTLGLWGVVAALFAVPLAACAASPAPQTIAESDVFLRADATKSFRDAKWWVHCDGVRDDAPRVSEAGVQGKAAQGVGSAVKFGKVPSPSGQGAPVLLFRAQANNAYHGGSPRCELSFRQPSQALPRNQVLWHAFSLWIDDWSTASDMIAVSQWFHSMTGAGLNPPFLIVARGNRLTGQVRFSESQTKMTKKDQGMVRLFEINGGFYETWLNFVIQAKVSPDPDDKGFMKIWLNGKQIADYQGPIGYAVPGARELVVHGNYPLVKGNIPLDLSIPQRDLFLGTSIVVLDPNGVYAEPTLRSVLEAAEAAR